jgi:hypothetical protein
MKIRRVHKHIGSFILVVVMSGCALPQTREPAVTNTATTAPTSTPTHTPSPTSTSTPTPAITLTPDVAYNIYDMNSFPADMKAVAMDPMKATLEQQQVYQSFLDNQRQKFFVEKGIQEVVDKMVASGKIFPEQAGLWGMAYWESMQTERGVIVLGPNDLKQAKLIEDAYHTTNLDGFQSWSDHKKIDGKSWGWSFSDRISDLEGILIGTGRVDATGNDILVMALLDQQGGKWSMVMRFVSDGSSPFFIPKGSPCVAYTGDVGGTQFPFPLDANLGKTDNYSKTDVLANFGRQVSTTIGNDSYYKWFKNYYNDYPFPDGKTWGFDCAHPYGVYYVGGMTINNQYLPAYPDMPWVALQQK